jgi:hypothetical protein
MAGKVLLLFREAIHIDVMKATSSRRCLVCVEKINVGFFLYMILLLFYVGRVSGISSSFLCWGSFWDLSAWKCENRYFFSALEVQDFFAASLNMVSS